MADIYNNKKSIHQLNKFDEESKDRNDIYPITIFDAVFDKTTGQSLTSYLCNFNSIFITFKGTVADTRKSIPINMRRKGIIVNYRDINDTIITEKYLVDDKGDERIVLDNNWGRIDELSLSGDITISSDGYWIINGEKTTHMAVGPKGNPGDTPYFRNNNNKLEYSFDKINWAICSDYIAAWFRFQDDKIQITRDNYIWEDLSKKFADGMYIKGYVTDISKLPSNAAQGDIYGVGPTYAADDTEHKKPIYKVYIMNDNGWVDHGDFTSIAAGVVQETGTSTTEIMSQNATTKAINAITDREIVLSEAEFDALPNVDPAKIYYIYEDEA